MNSTSLPIFLALAASAVLFLAACGASDFEGRDGNSVDGLEVTRDEYGDIWAFNVKAGTLECVSGGAAVFHNGGETYALNGPALEQNYAPLDKIRKRGTKLVREHYDVAVASGDLSPNIRSYDQFLDAFGTTEVYYNEFPHLIEKLRGNLEPMTDLALTLC